VLLTSIKHNVPREVVGDRYRIEHVLANLLSNAVKFSPEYGSIKITVSYGDRSKGCVTFTVADQGQGIPEEHIGKLFSTYMQLSPGELQQGKGTGVGLAICKEIVTLHGGRVGCSSKVRAAGEDPSSGGSRFFFSIPFTIIEEEDEEDDELNHEQLGRGSHDSSTDDAGELSAVSHHPFKVLIVDGNSFTIPFPPSL
jgi:signal transduction histidine kinase